MLNYVSCVCFLCFQILCVFLFVYFGCFHSSLSLCNVSNFSGRHLGVLGDFYALDTISWTWKSLTTYVLLNASLLPRINFDETGHQDSWLGPSPRYYFGFAALGHKLYVHGGLDNNSGVFLQTACAPDCAHWQPESIYSNNNALILLWHLQRPAVCVQDFDYFIDIFKNGSVLTWQPRQSPGEIAPAASKFVKAFSWTMKIWWAVRGFCNKTQPHQWERLIDFDMSDHVIDVTDLTWNAFWLFSLLWQISWVTCSYLTPMACSGQMLASLQPGTYLPHVSHMDSLSLEECSTYMEDISIHVLKTLA